MNLATQNLLLCFLYLCESGLMFSGRNAINSDSDTESTDFDLPPRILPWYFPPPQVPAPPARSPRPPEWLDRTPCERELGRDGLGRYPRLIEAEFPNNAVNIGGRHVNMACLCETDILMRCVIKVNENSIPCDIVRSRLDRTNLARLLPFFPYMTPQEMDPFRCPIGFRQGDCEVTAIIEMEITEYRAQSLDEQPRVSSMPRSDSSPSMLHYPDRRIPMRLCNAGAGESVCPIMHTPLDRGSIVYVLKQDRKKLADNQPVICISAEGLRKLADHSEDGQFVDPFHRVQQRLSISSDFDAYVVGLYNLPTVDTWVDPSDPGPSDALVSPSDMPPPTSPDSSGGIEVNLQDLQALRISARRFFGTSAPASHQQTNSTDSQAESITDVHEVSVSFSIRQRTQTTLNKTTLETSPFTSNTLKKCLMFISVCCVLLHLHSFQASEKEEHYIRME